MRSYYRLFLYLIVLCVVIFFFSVKDDRLYYDEGIEIAPNPDSVYQDIDLYFISSDGLVKEERHIKRSTGNRETDLFNELKKGSVNSELKSPLDKSTTIISIENIMGTCYVNFDSGFLTSKKWELLSKDLVVWSIVNSLTELDEIEKVQLLFNGDKVNPLDNIRLDKPLRFNNRVLIENTLSYYSVVKNFVDSVKNRYFVKAYRMMSNKYKEEVSLEEFLEYVRELSMQIERYDIVEYQTKRLDDDIVVSIRFAKNNQPTDEIYLEWKLVEEKDDIRIYFEEGSNYLN